jgi:hypothetical protein
MSGDKPSGEEKRLKSFAMTLINIIYYDTSLHIIMCQTTNSIIKLFTVVGVSWY